MAKEDTPLNDRVNRLLACFRRLRRTSLWKSKVDGGAGFLEITRGRSGLHWHPHLHVLLDGQFIPKHQLAAAWQTITGDSYIIDIQLIRDQSVVARYVTKYTAKPLDSRLHKQPDALREAIAAMRGRKLLHAFGSWSRWQLLALPSEPGWTLYAHINELLYRELCGDEEAHAIVLAILHLNDAATGHQFCTADPDERGPP